MADDVKDKTRILVLGTGRIIPPLPPGNYDVVLHRFEGTPHRTVAEALVSDYSTLERRALAELEISQHDFLERKTAIKEDWLRHWPAAAEFIRPPPGEEKTPHSDVAVLAALSVEVRRIRRRRSR